MPEFNSLNPAPDESLQIIEQTVRESRRSILHAGAAPILFIWGSVWMLGYLASWLIIRLHQPEWLIHVIWWPLTIAGILLTWLSQRGYPVRTPHDWRFGVTWGTVILFADAWLALCWPLNIYQLHVLGTSAIMLAWVIIGLITPNKLRITLGFLMAAFIFAGFGLIGRQPLFWLWMAIMGGGTMLAAGGWVAWQEGRHGRA